MMLFWRITREFR